MIFFRKKERGAKSRECLAGIISFLSRGAGPGWRHESSLELLIEYGEFESAVLDSLYPTADSYDRISAVLRMAGHLTGRIFCKTWKENGAEAVPLIDQLLQILHALKRLAIPSDITLRVAEGYAFYGLYPETYFESARTFFLEKRPEKVVCIGMRSIGTSLSSVVAAGLEEFGTKVYSFTVRPRGEPFRRDLRISQTLKQSLLILGDAHFIIIDEGPGMSGASMCCVASRLSELNIPDERVVFFPSWAPDGEDFVSGSSRREWKRHGKYTGNFDDIWINTGKLYEAVPENAFTMKLDISSGGWRHVFYEKEASYPAIHPHHEKRKFLVYPGGEAVRAGREAVSPDGSSGAVMLKFAGLGRYGDLKLGRAEQLHAAGFSQPVLGLSNGFLMTRVVPGRPVSKDEADTGLITAMAKYIAYLKKYFPSRHGMNFEDMISMIKRNTMLQLGPRWTDRLIGLEKYRSIFEETEPTALDGRMLPQEWIATPNGYVKTDAVDHHFDQFFHGSQDIAWDIAGAIVEFQFGRKEQDYFIERYKELAQDRDVDRRVSFYKIAYLAFRVGFAKYAAQDVPASGERKRFKVLLDRYAGMLKEEIAQTAIRQYSF